MSDFTVKHNNDHNNVLRFQINNCNDFEETLHILSGVLSQSVIETVIKESKILMNKSTNLINAFNINEITNILRKRWEYNLKKVIFII